MPVVQQLREKLQRYENLYLTMDVDVLDPEFAPAVQNQSLKASPLPPC
jgi:arginase family enzyme